MIHFILILITVYLGVKYLAPFLMKKFTAKIIGKMTEQAFGKQEYGSQQSSYSSSTDKTEEYHGSVLVHDEDSARRMKRMKEDAEDVEAVIIDEPVKAKEEEKVYR
ncbi:MAG: hypothetical protein MJZ00_07660 [Paludibacteraceae bacterium]|nr:hypothetical protein [Paludibacteraceae bacterium]